MFLVEVLNRRKLDKDNEEREIKLNYKKNKGKKMAPAVGFEPTTKWLTATYSTAELCRSKINSSAMSII